MASLLTLPRTRVSRRRGLLLLEEEDEACAPHPPPPPRRRASGHDAFGGATARRPLARAFAAMHRCDSCADSAIVCCLCAWVHTEEEMDARAHYGEPPCCSRAAHYWQFDAGSAGELCLESSVSARGLVRSPIQGGACTTFAKVAVLLAQTRAIALKRSRGWF